MFLDHLYDDSNNLRKVILELLAARKRHGINARWGVGLNVSVCTQWANQP